MAFKIFIDTNVFLDAFLERTADWKDAETMLQYAAAEQISAFTSASNLVNIMYVLEKQQFTKAEIIEVMELTLTYVLLAPAANTAFRLALRAGFADLEDAVQYFTATGIRGIDYFITSNTKDYKKATGQLPVVTPKQFLTIYHKK